MIFESRSIRVALDDQIATLWIDCPDNTDNRLTARSLDELEQALQAVQRAACVDLLLVRSGKTEWFSSGCDLQEVAALQTASARASFAARGQQVLQLLNHMGNGIITVAVIEGQC